MRTSPTEEHPDVGDSYNNMASVYNKQSKLDLALEYYEKSLAIRIKALGEASNTLNSELCAELKAPLPPHTKTNTSKSNIRYTAK